MKRNQIILCVFALIGLCSSLPHWSSWVDDKLESKTPNVAMSSYYDDDGTKHDSWKFLYADSKEKLVDESANPATLHLTVFSDKPDFPIQKSSGESTSDDVDETNQASNADTSTSDRFQPFRILGGDLDGYVITSDDQVKGQVESGKTEVSNDAETPPVIKQVLVENTPNFIVSAEVVLDQVRNLLESYDAATTVAHLEFFTVFFLIILLLMCGIYIFYLKKYSDVVTQLIVDDVKAHDGQTIVLLVPVSDKPAEPTATTSPFSDTKSLERY